MAERKVNQYKQKCKTNNKIVTVSGISQFGNLDEMLSDDVRLVFSMNMFLILTF